MRNTKIFNLPGETYYVERTQDEYIVTIRDQDGHPFINSKGFAYDIRINIKPDEDIEYSMKTSDDHHKAALAIAAGFPYITDIGIYHGDLVIELTLNGEDAKKVIYDPDIESDLDNPEVILVIHMHPHNEYAEFTYNIKREIPNSYWDELDYKQLLKDLFELQRGD